MIENYLKILAPYEILFSSSLKSEMFSGNPFAFVVCYRFYYYHELAILILFRKKFISVCYNITRIVFHLSHPVKHMVGNFVFPTKKDARSCDRKLRLL